MIRFADATPIRFFKSVYARVFAQSPSYTRSIANQMVVHHFARFSWIYVVVYLALWLSIFPSTLRAMQGSAFWGSLSVLVLMFVLPPFRHRILGGFQRFFQTFIAFALIGLNPAGTVLGFLDIFDRTSGSRHSAIPGHLWLDWNSDDSPILLSFTIGLAALAALLLALIPRLSVSRLRLAFVTLLVACSALTFCMPAAKVLDRHNSGDFLADLSASFIVSAFAGFTLIWSLIVIAILARHEPEAPIGAEAPAESPSNEYVKAASAIATTALVIAFFGLNTCWSYIASLDRFIAIREAFAADLVALAIPRSPQLQQNLINRTRTHKRADVGFGSIDQDAQADFEALKATPPPVNEITPRPLWLESVSIDSVIDHNDVFLASFPSGTMLGVTVKEVDRPHSWSAFPTLRFPNDLMPSHTLKVAAGCAGPLEDTTTYDKIYRACEKTVLDRGVKFPLIDVEFPIQYIILVTFIAICGCIILLSDRVQTILDLPASAKIEPWIVLDATTRTGKLLANAWAVGLCVAPWMLISMAVAIASLRIRVDGSVSDFGSDTLLAASLLAGVVISAWLSVSLLMRLAMLRLQRRVARQMPPPGGPPPSQEPPAETPLFDTVDVQ